MITAMTEGLRQPKEGANTPSSSDRDWMIQSVESMLRQTFPTFIIVGSRETTYFNEACRELLLPLSAAQGVAFRDLAPSLSAQLAGAVDAAWSNAATTTSDVRLYVDRPNGARETWVTAAITPVSREGKVFALLGVLRDVTEEKRLRTRLNAAEATLESLSILAPAFLWRLDARGVVRWMNARCQDFLGVGLAKAREDGWVGWLHPAERDRVVADWGRSVALAQPFESRHRLRDASGLYRWFTLRALPQFDEKGELHEWHSAALEVMDASPPSAARRLLWAADAGDWTRRYLNTDRQAGWPDDRSPVITWADQLAAVVEEDRPAFLHALETLAAGGTIDAVYRARSRAGDLFSIEDTAFPLVESDGSISRFIGESRIRLNAAAEILLVDPARRGRQLGRALEDDGFKVQTTHDLSTGPRGRKTFQGIVYCSDSTATDILKMAETVKLEYPGIALVVLGDPVATPREVIALHQAGVVDLLSYDESNETYIAAIRGSSETTNKFNEIDLPSNVTRGALNRLSAREREILALAVSGGTSKTIGRALGISPRTVDYHRGKALDKLGLKTVGQASDLFVPEKHYSSIAPKAGK